MNRYAGTAAAFVARRPLLSALVIVLLVGIAWVAYLDRQVTGKFEGRRWDLPAHVYARPLELFVGQPIRVEEFEAEIRRLGYRYHSVRPQTSGSYRRLGHRFELVTRPFRFWDGPQPSRFLTLDIDGGRVARLGDGRQDVPIARLEPLLIGSLFAAHGEDRLIVAPPEVPPLLPAALQAVEDRRFEAHRGVDPIALARALAANLRAGRIIQGGSTLTQQLVKNYFLDNRRTLARKVREAVMAVILEAHYDKQALLNAYINEVYMGQDGDRAIHGFGLASRFYFSRPLAELELHQIALLVALVRGPAYYDPYANPERAVARRNFVLQQMTETGAISATSAAAAAGQTLDLWDRRAEGATWYPGYLQLVRRQLKRNYRDEDLNREGLQIFTALDPGVQAVAERELAGGLERLEPAPADERSPLAGAVVVTSAASAEVLAVVGDRRRGAQGFNRALDARRPIGSLVKPAIYLAALASGTYTLASTVVDEPLTVPLDNGDTWQPSNFDNAYHGKVSLLRALAESLNLATVRLGLDVGLEAVADTLRRLGFDRRVAAYPSLLLGAVEMTPLEVADAYGTLANGGFHTSYRAVRSVIDANGQPLVRFPIEVEQAFNAGAVHQLNEGLVEVMRRGTGRRASSLLPRDFVVAGKSGTSNGFRDSWFAGFSGDYVVVVWVGYDDNRPTGRTGTTGALPIWAGILRTLGGAAWSQPPSPGLQERWVQYETGFEVAPSCPDAVSLALPQDSRLERGPRCGLDLRRLTERTVDWLHDLID